MDGHLGKPTGLSDRLSQINHYPSVSSPQVFTSRGSVCPVLSCGLGLGILTGVNKTKTGLVYKSECQV